ncbi:MAG: aldo/keto reductase [Proteobacteria bacterium]|nr:MAG: aldo/keto reductase [Pseudomonadota bacterium]
MNYRQLVQYRVSEVGLGCASYWGKKYFSERQAAQVVHRALDQGINYLDTGASYSGGHAEHRLGRILKQISNNKSLVVSSKVGTEVGHFGRLRKDFSWQNIRYSCERSLARLGVEQLSILFLHGPNVEDFNEDTYQALADLKQAGKVSLVGVNSFNPHIIQLTRDSGQFDVLMTDFNVFKPQQIKTLSNTRELGMAVIVAGALGGALYSRPWRHNLSIKNLWYGLRAFKNNRAQLNQAEHFDFLNKHPKYQATQLALAYVLQNKSLSSALVGSTSPQHIQQLAATCGVMLSREYLIKIQQAQQNAGIS